MDLTTPAVRSPSAPAVVGCDDLICPRCGGMLQAGIDEMICVVSACAQSYPLIEGVPILINEDRSVFRIAEFISRAATTFDWDRQRVRTTKRGLLHRVKRTIVDASPSLTWNIGMSIDEAVHEIQREWPAARVLVLGCGARQFHDIGNARIVYSDVSLGPITQIVIDATDIPFPDQSFDAVITAV